MVRTGTKTPNEVDGGEEVPAAKALAIAVMVMETRRLQSMHLKEKEKTVRFPNYKLPKLGINPINFRKSPTLFLYYARTKSSEV